MFKKNIISIDIGKYTTKIVIGKGKNKEIIIDHVFMIDTPPESYEDGYIKNLEAFKTIIYNILSKNKIKEKEVICTVQSREAITRELVLPYVKSDELSSMIDLEIEQYLPIRLEEYVVEYKILEEFTENNMNNIRVLVAALPKDMVEIYLELIKSLKLKPLALDMNANAIAKVFEGELTINNENYSLDKTVTLIDLGYEYINITIIDKGVIRFNRLIHQGGKDVDINIANTYNLSLEDAQQRKIEYANLEELNGLSSTSMLNEIVQSSVDIWIEEIQKIFRYYNSRHRGNKIDEIYLYGGSSNIKNLSKYMTDNLNIPTFKINEIDNIKLGKNSGEINLEKCLNAIGALIRR
ncbi:type IV pilus assembly protein PilM [Anaeromicrobium sediminis]|uniref:type IV pilus assembly protein PilM n=1 Tax=Anaeromicrobium sediminis TaxID=1478221 RepID=UPI001595746E|nr:type IV pilus assembly protein PilM [Anaeromicrobium sediminis]